MINSNQTSAPADDSLVFTEQARWLLEWHNSRSESFASRAVAILGFDGVIMALIIQASVLMALRPLPQCGYSYSLRWHCC